MHPKSISSIVGAKKGRIDGDPNTGSFLNYCFAEAAFEFKVLLISASIFWITGIAAPL